MFKDKHTTFIVDVDSIFAFGPLPFLVVRFGPLDEYPKSLRSSATTDVLVEASELPEN